MLDWILFYQKDVGNIRVENCSNARIELKHPDLTFKEEIPVNDYNINLDNCVFNNSSVVQNTNLQSPVNSELLRDLEQLSDKLKNREPLIANAINDLREAIQKKDEKTVQEKAKQLGFGMAASIIKEVASKTVLSYLRIV